MHCALCPAGLRRVPEIFPTRSVSVHKRSCVLQRELYGKRWGGRCPLCRAIALSLEKCVFRSFPKLFFLKVLTAVNIIWFTWSLEKTYHSDGQRMSICRAHLALRARRSSQVVAGSEYMLELGHPCPTHHVGDLNSSPHNNPAPCNPEKSWSERAGKCKSQKIQFF